MINLQPTFKLSPYIELYDILVRKDNLYRRLHDEIDYSFIPPMLQDCYDAARGRMANDPVQMIKYLVIKALTDMSDIDIVNHARTDLAMKYFLDMVPEEEPIEKSSISTFRTQRIENADLLNELLDKTIDMAVEKGILRRAKSGKIIIEASVDSTHISVMGSWMSPLKAVGHYCSSVYEAVKKADSEFAESMEKMPKRFESALEAINFAKRMSCYVRENLFGLEIRQFVRERLNRLEEVVEDLENRSMYCPCDPEARLGYKSKDKRFSGYKGHLIVENENGLAVGCQVTTGEKNDTTVGRRMLEGLLDDEKYEVTGCLGDSAYSATDIVEKFDEANVELIAPPNQMLCSSDLERNGFTYNKDANSITCPAGHLAIYSTIRRYKKEHNRPVRMYYFDIEKCKICKRRQGCYKEGSKSKSYSVSLNSDLQKEYKEKMSRPETKEKFKRRTIVERANSELKDRCGLRTAHSKGLKGVTVQAAIALFTYNLRIILRKTAPKAAK